MRCKSCDYPLWNIRARECPECGDHFQPSDFTFVPNAVRYCCPHCDQSYYGTDGKGHLVPRTFDCVSCGERIEMDGMVIRPGEGGAEAVVTVDANPWLQREKRGWFSSFFRMIGRGSITPHRLMAGTPLHSSLGSAWLFALIANALYVFFGAFLVHGTLFLFTEVDSLLALVYFLAAMIVAMLLLPFFYILLWGLITHAMLKITGGTAYSMRRTFQAILYTAGANVLTAIPCMMGSMFGWVWWAVSASLAVATGQKVHGGRATMAVITWPLLTVLVVVGGMFGLFAFAATQMSAAIAQAQAAQQNPINGLNMALQNYVTTNGSPPNHGIELTTTPTSAGPWAGGMASIQFVDPTTGTFEADVPLDDDNTLADFITVGQQTQQTIINNAIAALPNNVIAHRVGDYVFVYHGAPIGNYNQQLWTIVMVPDPDVNGTPLPGDAIYIADDAFQVQEITYAELPAELQQQNTYRQSLGLAPLPDLTTVTHDQPATGGP